ncbi:MAG: DUF4153 domain-containing protein [Actinomycetota bacterium]
MERAVERSGFFEQLAAFEAKPTTTDIVWPVALVAAWSFDFLFWDKAPGISFPIFVLIILGCGYVVARSTSARISSSAKWLLLPVALFSLGSTLRAEPLTMVLDYLVTLALLGLAADTFAGGRWLRYRLPDYIVAFLHVGVAGIVRGGIDIRERRAKRTERAKRVSRYAPVVRGILLSLPLLVAFGLLLASADLVFSRFLTRPFPSLDSGAIGEYAFRVMYILVLAYGLTGLFLHAVRPSESAQSPPMARAEGGRGIEMVEGSIVLGSVNGLFALFVGFQFRYFFAGSGAISDLDMTYAEYARRGFGELVFVALLTLILLVVLSLVVRRVSHRQHKVFSLLSSGTVVLTGIILVSAFQRLLLYEDAYGFTRLRTYSHVFMVWLGLTLIAVLVLQWKNSLRSVTLVLVLAGLGYAASLNVIGVDAFIARSNIDRAVRGAELDVFYLNQLSSDAVPTLLARVDDLSPKDRRLLSNVLVCKALAERNLQRPWQSTHLSNERSRAALLTFYERLAESRRAAPTCGPVTPN